MPAKKVQAPDEKLIAPKPPKADVKMSRISPRALRLSQLVKKYPQYKIHTVSPDWTRYDYEAAQLEPLYEEVDGEEQQIRHRDELIAVMPMEKWRSIRLMNEERSADRSEAVPNDDAENKQETLMSGPPTALADLTMGDSKPKRFIPIDKRK